MAVPKIPPPQPKKDLNKLPIATLEARLDDAEKLYGAQHGSVWEGKMQEVQPTEEVLREARAMAAVRGQWGSSRFRTMLDDLSDQVRVMKVMSNPAHVEAIAAALEELLQLEAEDVPAELAGQTVSSEELRELATKLRTPMDEGTRAEVDKWHQLCCEHYNDACRLPVVGYEQLDTSTIVSGKFQIGGDTATREGEHGSGVGVGENADHDETEEERLQQEQNAANTSAPRDSSDELAADI